MCILPCHKTKAGLLVVYVTGRQRWLVMANTPVHLVLTHLNCRRKWCEVKRMVGNAICSVRRWTSIRQAATGFRLNICTNRYIRSRKQSNYIQTIKPTDFIVIIIINISHCLPYKQPQQQVVKWFWIVQLSAGVRFQTSESNSGDWPLVTWTRHVSELCCARKSLRIETLTPAMEQINLHLR